MRFLLRLFFKITGVRFRSSFQHLSGTVLYVSNHVSILDALFLYAFLPKDLFFALSETEMRDWRIKWLMRFAKVVSFSPLELSSVKNILSLLEAGKSGIVFVEGQVTQTGNLMKIYEASGLLADKAKVPLVPIWIQGPQFGFCSHLKNKNSYHLFPRVIITVNQPVQFVVENERRKDRNYISNELYRLMLKASFESSFNSENSFFKELMMSAKNNAHRGFFARTAFIEDTRREPYAYKDLLTQSYLFGRYIAKLIKNQETFGVMLPNSIHTLCVICGALAYERVPAMLNFSSGLSNLTSCIKTAQIKDLITSKEFVENQGLKETVQEFERLGVRVFYIEDIVKTFSVWKKIKAYLSYKTKYVPNPKSGEKRAIILFTSGSEGNPKAVVLSHQNIVANVYQLSSMIDINGQDLMFNALPMFHSFGLVCGTFYPLLAGGRLFLYPTPLHYRQIPELIYQLGATMLFGTDTFLRNYAKVAHPFDFQTLRFVLGGAEPVREETRRFYMERFGIRLFEAYGTTECSPLISINSRIFNHFGSIGQIVPAMAYKLEKVPSISDGGALCVSGPNLMMGYMRPENPGVIEPPADGWYNTGDIVSVDEMGFFYIKDRLKRFAKIAGEMVSLTAVEKVVRDIFNDDYEYAAVAIPHSSRGEQIVLATTNPAPDMNLLKDKIQDAGYPEFYIPRAFVVLDEMPTIGSGKRDLIGLKRIVLEKNSTLE